MRKIFVCLSFATFVCSGATIPLEEADDNTIRIVGGQNAKEGEFPYQICLQMSSGSVFCGGSVIDDNTILTAAHCLDGKSASSIRVVAGEHDLTSNSNNEQILIGKKKIIHENYVSSNFLNDIALLITESAFQLNEFVQPVQLTTGENDASEKCTVTGWGTLSYGGASPAILQKVEVPLVPDYVCEEDYGDSLVHTPSMICAGESGKDSCQGDSGGPLLCGSTQSGIVSWGIDCAQPVQPGVYTQVSYFVDWIHNNNE